MAEDGNNYGCAGLGILILLVIIGAVACFNRFNNLRDRELIGDLPTSTAVPGISESAMPEAATQGIAPVETADSVPAIVLEKTYTDSAFSIGYPAGAVVGSPSQLTTNQVVRIGNLSAQNQEDARELAEREFYMDLRMKEGGDDCRNSMLDAQTQIIDESTVYRGNAKTGSYRGYRSTLCFNRSGDYYRIDLTEGSPQRPIAKAVFNSLRIEK